MPVDWEFAKNAIALGGAGIGEKDAERQMQTARAIVEALRDQPGIVLADEVGMGKTYVTLGVVASVLLSTPRSSDPVIVMVPPGLRKKWQREWHQFVAKCTTSESLAWMRGRDRYAKSPTDFFKMIDGPLKERPRLIWLTTSCFAQGLGDGWLKLAFVRLARRHTRMDDEAKQRLYKWATTLTQLRSRRGLSAAVIEHLMATDLGSWKTVLVGYGLLDDKAEDPIPKHLTDHADDLRWKELIGVLRNDLRGKESRGARGV